MIMKFIYLSAVIFFISLDISEGEWNDSVLDHCEIEALKSFVNTVEFDEKY